MKALILESNSVLKYRAIPVSEISEDECLVAIKYAAICNSDISRAYNNGAYFYPLVMGHEMSGVIEKTGKRVKNYKIGDRVAVFPLIPCRICDNCKVKNYAQCSNYDYYGSRRNGGFAEYLPVKEWNLFKIPESIDLKYAALLEPMAVAIHSLRKIKYKANDVIGIFGAGFIGLVIAKWLTYATGKKNIYIIDHNDFKLEIADSYGINTINPDIDKEWLKNIQAENGGGFDHIFEACGSVETYKQSIAVAKNHSNVLWVGNIRSDLILEKKVVSSILRRELKVIGCWNSQFSHNKNDDWYYAIEFIKKSNNIKKIISHIIPLKEGASIFKRLYANRLKENQFKKEFFHKVIFKQ